MKKKKVFKYSALLLLVIFVIFWLSFGIYSIVYSNKVYANQYLGTLDLGGKGQVAVKDSLDSVAKSFLNTPTKLTFKVDGGERDFEIKPEEIGLKYDLDASFDQVWRYGRGDNVFTDFGHQLRSLFLKTPHTLVYSLDEEVLKSKLAQIAAQIDTPEKDFTLEYKNGEFVLNSERKAGKRINQEEVRSSLTKRISIGSKEAVYFSSDDFKPQISEENAKISLREANQILSQGDLTLSYDNNKFSIDGDTIGGLITSKTNGDKLELVLNQERAKDYVASLAKSIDTDPSNAQLSLADGKVVVSKPAVLGKTLDQDQTRLDIGNSLFARITKNSVKADAKSISLKVNIKKPEITDDAVSTLGISELIGTGTTDFKKSPSNRVHNIEVGAKALNGVLLKPGETFSTLGRLGKIDASGGYLEELVIKENRTVPEFGGGLCQVSSTLFRAAMNAGVKIVERQNHKYRVSYYEPPVGMDATIYDPAPDFKFENNYNNYIFIQSHIDGTKITFDLYGTKDGRSVAISNPEVYDVVDPGAPIITETDTLPPGEKKLLERGHQGASARFSYKVTLGDKTLQDKTFVSKYVPWPEKWLVGKALAAAPTVPVAPAETPAAPTN